MEKIHAEIVINAPVQIVWSTMLEDETFRQWTSAFTEGSHFKGSWEEGEKILVLGPEGNGGMVSTIAENRPHEFISIKHIGVIKDGVEDTESEEVKKWAPAYENYTFEEKNGKTELSVDMDIGEEHKETFSEMWANALKQLKNLCER